MSILKDKADKKTMFLNQEQLVASTLSPPKECVYAMKKNQSSLDLARTDPFVVLVVDVARDLNVGEVFVGRIWRLGVRSGCE